MKNFFLLFLVTIFTACASTPKGTYKEQATPKFANTKDFNEKPEEVRRAAKVVLEELTQASEPPASKKVHEDGDTLRTGWVYGTSRDKYVEYKHNGTPRRKALAVRRQYAYTISPGLGGSQVIISLEEEVEDVDLNTGENQGWKNAAPDQAIYDQMLRKLREKIRAL
jgi:hypothetical protein